MFPFTIIEHVIQASHIRDYPRATATSQNEALLLAVKQYVPKDNASPQKGDVTVIGAHGCGLPKELYEPLWESLYHETRRRGIRIRSIFIAEAAWLGRSGILNEGKLGNDPGWNDYARDIVHLVNHFRPPAPLLGIGHSLGGNSMANASLLHPRLFSGAGLVLIEPAIVRFDYSGPYPRLGQASWYRVESWPSRAAAAAFFRGDQLYQAWDPVVLDRWIEFGLRDVARDDAATRPAQGGGSGGSGKEVTLVTSKHQEIFTYLRPSWPACNADGSKAMHREHCPDLDEPLDPSGPKDPFSRSEGVNTLARLPNVFPGVLYVVGGQSFMSTPKTVREWTATTGTGTGGNGGARLGRVKNVSHPDHGHFIPMEAPAWCAREVADWAKGELDRWWAEERDYEQWAKKPLAEKTTVGGEFKRYMGVQDRDGDRVQAKVNL